MILVEGACARAVTLASLATTGHLGLGLEKPRPSKEREHNKSFGTDPCFIGTLVTLGRI